MKVGLDVDGVLADFYLGICERFGTLPYEKLDKWEMSIIEENFPKIINDTAFWDGLKVLNHPSMLTFEFDYYITAIPDHLLESRIAWLKRNGFPDKPVIIAEDKVTACKELGVKFLIDDKPGTMQLFYNDPDLVGIQYSQPDTSMIVYGDYQINCLTEVADIIFWHQF